MLVDKELWIKNTGGSSPARSKTLTLLDAAIAVANRTEEPATLVDTKSASAQADSAHEMAQALCVMALSHVSDALGAWMKEQAAKHEQGWVASRRNAKGAVEALVQELRLARAKYQMDDNDAMNTLKEARNSSIPVLFKGAACISRSSKWDFLVDGVNIAGGAASGAGFVNSVRTLVHRQRGAGAEVPQPVAESAAAAPSAEIDNYVKELIKKAFQQADGRLEGLSWEVGEEFFRDLVKHAVTCIKAEIAAAVPFFGATAALGLLLYAANQLRVARSELLALEKLHGGLELGDSRKALEAIHAWQVQDRAHLGSRAARAALGLGSHVAMLASGGTLTVVQGSVGIVNSLVALVDLIAEVGQQYQGARALTQYLNRQGQPGQLPLGPEVFRISPLAGAYYILNVPSSHIAMQFVDLGAPGWQEEVERLVLHGDMTKVRAGAARLIDNSRYRIVPASGKTFVETVEKSLVQKLRS